MTKLKLVRGRPGSFEFEKMWFEYEPDNNNDEARLAKLRADGWGEKPKPTWEEEMGYPTWYFHLGISDQMNGTIGLLFFGGILLIAIGSLIKWLCS